MKKYKKGDKHPTKNLIFHSYSHSGEEDNVKLNWLSPEAYKRKEKAYKEYRKSEKCKEYYREYYLKNKEYYKGKRKIKREREIQENPLKILLYSVRDTSKSHKKEFNLTHEYLLELWKSQNGRCHYSNFPMKCTTGNKSPEQVSIDRIDSSKGYIQGNIALCCLSINFAKNSFSEQDLRLFLKNIKNTI